MKTKLNRFLVKIRVALSRTLTLTLVLMIVSTMMVRPQAAAQTAPNPTPPGAGANDIERNGWQYGGWYNYVPGDKPLGGGIQCGGGPGTETGGPAACGNLQGSDKEEQAYNFFRGKGQSVLVSSAIIGNLKLESRLDPAIVNRSSGATGIAQWLGPRLNSSDPKVGLKAFAQAAGKSYTDFCLQLDFLWFEVTEGSERRTQVLQKMKAREDVMLRESRPRLVILDELTIMWEDIFERSGGAGIPQRQREARETFQRFEGVGGPGQPGTPTAPVTGAPTDTCAPGGAVGGQTTIVQKALELAWPWPFAVERIPGRASPLTPKPEYVAALSRSNRNQRSDGADCGVFVATVLRDSQVDRNYPGVSTTAQYQYMVDHPEIYQRVGNVSNTSELVPGDIAIVTAAQSGRRVGHTWIYVGPQARDYYSASASLDSRSGNLGREKLAGFTIFRVKATSFTGTQ
jgi:hypothetical protein